MVAPILLWILQLYTWVLFARVIGSWILFAQRGAEMPSFLQPVWRLVLALTDPPLRVLGRWIKPIRIGDIAIDVAFLALFATVWLLEYLVATFIQF